MPVIKPSGTVMGGPSSATRTSEAARGPLCDYNECLACASKRGPDAAYAVLLKVALCVRSCRAVLCCAVRWLWLRWALCGDAVALVGCAVRWLCGSCAVAVVGRAVVLRVLRVLAVLAPVGQ